MRTRLADSAPEPAPGGLDLGSCEREPIHLLGAVQGFGFLLAAGPDGTVQHASANVADHLGVPLKDVIGRPLSALLQREAMHDITGALQSLHGHHQTERLFGLDLVAGRPPYDVAVHMAPGGDAQLTVVEAEPSAAEPRFDPVATVKGMMARLLSGSTLEDMHERAARQLRTVLGFDRVMATASTRTAAARWWGSPSPRTWSPTAGCATRPPTSRSRPGRSTAATGCG